MRAVKKVDKRGKQIKNFKIWKKSHPSEKFFDSKLEYVINEYIESLGIPYTYQPDTIELIPKFKCKEFKKNEVVECSQQSIKYTPDFYIEGIGYIESKGDVYFLKNDAAFRIRWRMFKSQGYNGYIVTSLKEFITLYKKLTNEKQL